MLVSELIALLQIYDPDLPVIYQLYSEYETLEAKDIAVENRCLPRPDGWVANLRPDKASQPYLVFPGN